MNTKYSISAASRITGKGRATIRRHLNDGTLSYETDKDGKMRVIDASELARVYEIDQREFEREQGKGKENKTSRSVKDGPQDIHEFKEQYEARLSQFSTTIERLEKELDQAHERDRENQEGYKQSLRLLENHSAKAAKNDEWRSAFAEMEEKLANQEQRVASQSEKRIAEREESHKKKMARMKQELEAERNKNFWQKLFG